VSRHRSVLVTGGSRGIGRAVALALGEAGHAVTVAAIHKPDPTCAALVIETDVTDSASVHAAVAAARDAHGPIEILINCAGWDALMPFVETDEVFWERVIETNLMGVLRTTHAVLPSMLEVGWGRIVNIASDAGRVGSTYEAVYSGAKGGVIAFTKAIAREAARRGVTANAVCPGPTETALLDEMLEAKPEWIGGLRKAVPMRRFGTPQDVAAAVMFLASEEAGYITGQTLSVSGGLTMA
jgi:2-hydroxycyclohexanecarboxyl-CoA dehydrogenase